MRSLSRKERQHLGALIGVSGDLGSSFCSVTDAQGDLGRVTFGPRCPDGKNEVNLQSLRFLRFSGFVSEISKTIRDCTVKWNTITGCQVESCTKTGLLSVVLTLPSTEYGTS